jgi:hypothetical protein
MVPNNNGEFAQRVAALKQRIDALQVRLAESQQKLEGYLAQLAVHELDEQKGRLAAYQVQARFALATMYDRAANEEENPKKEPGAAVPKSMEEKGETPEQGASPTPVQGAPQPDQGAAPSQGASPPDPGPSPKQDAPPSPPPGADPGAPGTPKP